MPYAPGVGKPGAQPQSRLFRRGAGRDRVLSWGEGEYRNHGLFDPMFIWSVGALYYIWGSWNQVGDCAKTQVEDSDSKGH